MFPELEPVTRARLRTILRVALVVVLVWVLATVGLIFLARQRVSSGLDTLQRARDHLTADGLLRGQALPALQQAERDFNRAHSLAANPVLAPWSIVPLASGNVDAVRSLTSAAEHVAAVGARAARDGSAALRSHPATGAERLAVLDRVAAIAGRAARDLDHVSLGPDFFLIGPLGDARARFVDRLQRLRDALTNAQALAAGAAQVLRGPRTYLVLAANNGEMRAGSGMFLSSGIATFGAGTFTLGQLGPSADRDLSASVALPPQLQSLWGWLSPGRHWRNLATTPRFDVTAPVAAQMWQAATGQHVDGVLAVDAVALQALLAAQGPVTVAGQELTGSDALSYLLLGQYAGIPAVDASQADRRDQLSAIARAAVDTLSSRPWNAQNLVSELSNVGKGRHILAWSRDATEERAWEGAGISGELQPDSLAVSVMNFGGNKLDQFLRVDSSLTVTAQPDGGSDAEVQLRLHNDAPTGIPGYVGGPSPDSGVGEGVYQGILSVNVPGAASLPTIGGITPALVGGIDGPTKIAAAGYFRIARGQTLPVTVRFRLPPSIREMTVAPSARTPSIAWTFRSLKFTDSGVEHVTW
ncbi:MAG TPA: DUF4012 domain-containing protein [Acidimicrobiia bacterium]|nr:DUF4012 domain-containing protein [Acidimicrobiia bacterium]